MLRKFLGLHTERRHDRRFDAEGAWLVCNGHRLPVADLSLSGVRVRHAPTMLRPGQQVDFALDLPMPGRPLSVHGRAQVVRIGPGEFALCYSTLDHRLLRTLHFFLGGRRPVGNPPH